MALAVNARMPILGAHMSVAGGFDQAVDRADRAGCDCVQIFTKNNSQWRAKPIEADDVRRFHERLEKRGIRHTSAHASYLINIASPSAELRQKSIDALVIELQRAAQLGVPHVVVHPGSHTTATEQEGIDNAIGALDQVCAETADLPTWCLLENTAGQGTNLGHRLEQLQLILQGVTRADRLGVCLDSCHLFAAGYDLRERKDYLRTMREVKRTVGIETVKVFHLNDSKRELGSRVDRHEHIGRGEIGDQGFAHLVNDRRFRRVPMYLETPKGDSAKKNWDRINLRRLRRLVRAQ